MKDCDRYNVSSLLSVVNYLQEENNNDTLYTLVKGLHFGWWSSDGCLMILLIVSCFSTWCSLISLSSH